MGNAAGYHQVYHVSYPSRVTLSLRLGYIPLMVLRYYDYGIIRYASISCLLCLQSLRRFSLWTHLALCVTISPMQRGLRFLVLALLGGLLLLVGQVKAQGAGTAVRLYALVSKARLDEGLAPYNLSTLLSVAAQRHADDLAAHQIWSHTGSDGSTPKQRIAEAGYAAWTWNGGDLVVSENFWTGYGTIEDAMAFFLEDLPHRGNILSTNYREVGIGAATDAAGRNYYVLDFGVRPNVLPIYINDGAARTDNPQVAIRLTNEEARPGGQGTAFMGQAIEIRISDKPDFDDQPWQSWEPLVPWTLPDTPGEHTIYVQFRDAAGRTAASADTIVLGEGTDVTPTPIPPSPTPEPTATPIPPSLTPEPTATPEPTVTPTLEPTATLAPVVTSTPEPPPTVEPTSTPDSLPPSPLAPSTTPFPTWTPLPTAAPQEVSSPDAPLAVLATLQGVALILGIYLALRRSGGSTTGA
jgi:uncharacterized protein YkwD